MKSKLFTTTLIASLALTHETIDAQEIELDPIVITSDFRDKKLSQTSNSVSIIGGDVLYDKASQPFEEIIGQTPNVNFASGASRAHYIQIRGIGERSQFQSPVNPSVGIAIDGIDFSQSALGVTMFDVESIEVLKGPQGTTFGANGMAGVVSIQSKEPTKEPEGHIEATVGNYNAKAIGIAVGGSLIEDKLLGRISIYKNSNDGFMKNSYLGREDTNNIDELTAKAQLRLLLSDKHTIDLNIMHLDVDNGYDAFTLDNSRVSHADEPGKDKQKTNAFSLKSTNQITPGMHLISKVSYSSSDIEYSYDEDWSFVGEFDDSLWPYHYFDQYLRQRDQADFDIRLISDASGRIFNGTTDWTIGAYAKTQTEDLTRNRTKEGELEIFTNSYKTNNIAAYTQIDSDLSEKLKLTAGIRLEKWEAKYSDSNAVHIDTDELLKGGKLGLQYKHDDNYLYYINLLRGYKPGGVNADSSLAISDKYYKTETLWNLDFGLNSSHFNGKLKSRINFFYGKRKDQQVKMYIEESKKFTDYLKNAAKGHYYGVESRLDYYTEGRLHLYATLGLLKSEFDDYTPELDGRAPAHAPEYQYNLGFDYSFADNWMLKGNLERKGSYYFSSTHDEKSEAYKTLNTSLTYMSDDWTVTLWARNITDEKYETRGFYFENDPSIGYEKARYTQQGAPRSFGLTVAYEF